MPRTRFDKKKHDKLSVLVCGYVYKDGGTLADGADKTGMSRATLCRRLAQPGGFTVDELGQLIGGENAAGACADNNDIVFHGIFLQRAKNAGCLQVKETGRQPYYRLYLYLMRKYTNTMYTKKQA